jgi:hypothetical protein
VRDIVRVLINYLLFSTRLQPVSREKQGLKIIMGHKDILTKLLIKVTEPVIVIDILNNMEAGVQTQCVSIEESAT